MAQNPPNQNFFTQLMALNRETFEAGLFDTAYHCLAAAMHCARTLKSDESLLEVENAAMSELAWIDKNHPEYEHSTKSAAKRQHESIFALLATQTHALLQMQRTNRGRKIIH